MKLPGWMHRKFRQNGNEDQSKDYAPRHSCTCLTGKPSPSDHRYYLKQNAGIKPPRQAHIEYDFRKSFAGIEPETVEEYREDQSTRVSFLAIGTLGSDSAGIFPPTPTFSLTVDNITEKETEVTEYELKLINDELEKVLVAEAGEDGRNGSSGRSSHVSNGRSSHGSSTNTVGGKPLEITEVNGNIGTQVCPLQGYLLGSAIEFPETAVGKKEQRASLGELFQRTNMASDENPGSKSKKGEKPAEKLEENKSAVSLTKKKQKNRKIVNPSSRSSDAASNGVVDPASRETKLHKMLHMFCKKVYPESSPSRKKPKPRQDKIRKNSFDGGYNNGSWRPLNEDIMALSSKNMQRSMSQSNPPQVMTPSCSEFDGNKEYWIKTDEDYLVLEL